MRSTDAVLGRIELAVRCFQCIVAGRTWKELMMNYKDPDLRFDLRLDGVLQDCCFSSAVIH